MTELLFPLTVGFLGSLHCLGMCGPLVFAYSLQAREHKGLLPMAGGHSLWSGIFHHLAFHAGRLLTYGMLGAIAAGLIHLAAFDEEVFKSMRGLVALAGGIAMIFLGLTLLRVLPVSGFSDLGARLPASFRERILSSLFRSHRPGAKIAFGLCAGFLPCGLTWAMLIKAASTQNMVNGFLTMVAFGLGTLPALIAAGLFTSVVSLKFRLLGERLAATTIIFMGIFMIRAAFRVLA